MTDKKIDYKRQQLARGISNTEEAGGCALIALAVAGLTVCMAAGPHNIANPSQLTQHGQGRGVSTLPASLAAPEPNLAGAEFCGQASYQLWAEANGASWDVIQAIRIGAGTVGISPEALTALVYTESKFDPDARGDHGASRGMCQIQSCWDDDYREWTGDEFDPYHPEHAAICAALILVHYGWDCDDHDAQLQAYARYNGSRRVNRYARKVAALAAEIERGGAA